jgi:7-carboxy-7-deazaguanine synthase
MSEVKLNVYSIYPTVNGEVGLLQGAPTVFLRLAGCPLRCVWCDTPYALTGNSGTSLTTEQVFNKINKYQFKNVCITGGDPMVQQKRLPDLIDMLVRNGYRVSMETSGAIKINTILDVTDWVFDYKLPGSKEHDKMMTPSDFVEQYDIVYRLMAFRSMWIKMVVANPEDFKCAESFMFDMQNAYYFHYHTYLDEQIKFAVSPVWDLLHPSDLFDMIQKSPYKAKLNLNLQIHKWIWPLGEKGDEKK